MTDAKEEAKGSPVLHGFHHQGATPAPEFVKQSEARTITMLFPRPVTLLLDNHQRIEFKAGPQEVPVELVQPKLHFYLEHNNVKPYVPVPPVVQGKADDPKEEVDLDEQKEEQDEQAEEGETDVADAVVEAGEAAPVEAGATGTGIRRPTPRRRRG